MATEVIMPKVDMVMESGTFVEWLKEEGDTVKKDEPIFIVLTDKANIEVESPASGILAGMTAKPDDVIPVTEVIAYILAPGESLRISVAAAATTRIEMPSTPRCHSSPRSATQVWRLTAWNPPSAASNCTRR